jgi:nucleoside-diphosphate-sugar epimerase
MEKSAVLVTGAAGFVGSRLTEVLLASGRNVVALDCFLSDLYPAEIKKRRWDKLDSISGGTLEKVVLDLRKDDLTKLSAYPITSIINQAAMPGLSSDWSKFAPYYECNLSALNRLLEFARTMPIRSFIQASTSSVYGISAIGDESQETKPTSPYGVSKLAAEKLLLAYKEWFSVPVKILRYFSIYGPNQRPDMAYAKIIRCLKDGTPFHIYGNGEQRRSNTFIDDVVNATILAETKAEPGDIMNICGNDTISLNFAIQFLEKISGLSLNRKTEEKRSGDQIDTSGINKFACEKLGWQSKVGIREGLERQLKESY